MPRSKWVVRRWSETFTIEVDPDRPMSSASGRQMERAFSALLFECESCDPRLVVVLEAIQSALFGARPPRRWRGSQASDPMASLRGDLERAHRMGRLLVSVEHRPLVAVRRTLQPPALEQQPQPRLEREPISERPTSLDALEIALCDENGDPMPDAEYEVTLPDGSRRTGRLNSNGVARFERIPPGVCNVTFPALDSKTWELSSSDTL